MSLIFTISQFPFLLPNEPWLSTALAHLQTDPFTAVHCMFGFKVIGKANGSRWDSPLPSGRITKLKMDSCICLLGPHTKAQYSESTSYFNKYHLLFQLLTTPSHPLCASTLPFALRAAKSSTPLPLLRTGLAAGQRNPDNNSANTPPRLTCTDPFFAIYVFSPKGLTQHRIWQWHSFSFPMAGILKWELTGSSHHFLSECIYSDEKQTS